MAPRDPVPPESQPSSHGRDNDPLRGAPGGILAVAGATMALIAAGLAIATLVSLLVG